jgi:hypothetical protein
MKAGKYSIEIRLLQFGEPVERLLIGHGLRKSQAVALRKAASAGQNSPPGDTFYDEKAQQYREVPGRERVRSRASTCLVIGV